MRERATRAYARRGVDEAVDAFGGTGSDQRIWARIAWRVGYENFLDVVRVILAESNGIRNPAGFLTAQFAAALLVSSVSKGELYE